jgi:hypothetical protein
LYRKKRKAGRMRVMHLLSLFFVSTSTSYTSTMFNKEAYSLLSLLLLLHSRHGSTQIVDGASRQDDGSDHPKDIEEPKVKVVVVWVRMTLW